MFALSIFLNFLGDIMFSFRAYFFNHDIYINEKYKYAASEILTAYLNTDFYKTIEEQNYLTDLKKYKNKLVEKHQGQHYFKPEFIEKDYSDDDEVKIVRTKKFDIKPMYAEDACVQMELTGHNFFVFCNAETDQVNVVYKRKGNTYGLIEPEY